MLSTQTRYVLRALVEIARSHGQGAVNAGELAVAIDAPRKYLEASLTLLRRANLLVSVRGPKGGYVLAREPGAISFADVIRVLDGPLALAPCASRSAFRRCETCPSVELCQVHPALAEARDAVVAVLEGWTLETAARRAREAA